MIQNGTFLNVIDNSGAKKVCCIKVLKGYRRRYASVGDIITVSIKSVRQKKKVIPKVKKGEVTRALIIRTKSMIKRPFFESIAFNENAVVLLNKQNKLLGTRIFGSISKYFRYTLFLKTVTLSSGIIV